MAYEILEIELSDPPDVVRLPASAEGFAVLLRRDGRPIDFWLEPLLPPRVPDPAEVERRVSARIARAGLESATRSIDRPLSALDRGPSLSVAVCTRDRPELALACVRSVSSQLASTTGGEVIVVDNAPSDGRTREAVGALPDVRYVCEPIPGLNFARNRALREARGDLIAYIDDDVVVDRGWLCGLLGAVADNPDAGGFTGQILPLELWTPAQVMFERRGGFRRGFSRVRYDRDRPTDVLYPCRAGMFGNGANMAFRRSTLERLGGFDEALDTGPELPGGGDLDIFYRLVRAGYPLVYEPECLVFHKHRRDMPGLHRQYRDSWGKAAMAYAGKCLRTDSPNRPRIVLFILWWFLHELWQVQKSLRGRHAVPLPMLLAELGAGVTGLFGCYARSRRRTQRLRQATLR